MKSKQKYHVKLISRVYSDDGLLEYEEVIYEQDTWAVSAKKAENNVRHNSGYPFHGHASFDANRYVKVIEADVRPAFRMPADGRLAYE